MGYPWELFTTKPAITVVVVIVLLALTGFRLDLAQWLFGLCFSSSRCPQFTLWFLKVCAGA
jgi:hypothetical protein